MPEPVVQQPAASYTARETSGPNDVALIRLAGIRKVFVTDEVETHALSDIQLEIRQGEYVAIAAPGVRGTAPRRLNRRQAVTRGVLIPVGRVLADKLGPRTLMLAADVVRCVVVAALAVLAARHVTSGHG